MSPELINNIATLAGVLVAALGAFLFAFWVAMGIWTFNDIRSRTHDWLAILLAVLLVLVFPIVGLILYSMIRPRATLAEVYDRALEEEALLRELEEMQACPTCGTPVKEGWIFCPNCHGQLQHSCPACSNLVRNEWVICVYCGASQRPAALREPVRELQPSYQPGHQSGSALRPGSEAKAPQQLGSAAHSGAGAAGAVQPAPQPRVGRNLFRSGAPAPITATPSPAPQHSSAPLQPSAPQSLAAPQPPFAESGSLPPAPIDYSNYGADYSDYDDNPYRPARAGEG